MLTSHGASSLVIDIFCDQVEGRNAAVACFYLDFAARNDQSTTSVLGTLLKQLVCGLEEALEEALEEILPSYRG